MSYPYSYEDFFAICDHEPGAERVIRVGGTIVFMESGWSARLKEFEGNPGINPFLLHLDLVLEVPTPPTADVIVRFELPEWRQAPPLREYDQVEFHLVGHDGDPPPILKVSHPE
jgi:hypothetical protein